MTEKTEKFVASFEPDEYVTAIRLILKYRPDTRWATGQPVTLSNALTLPNAFTLRRGIRLAPDGLRRSSTGYINSASCGIRQGYTELKNLSELEAYLKKGYTTPYLQTRQVQE